MRRTVNSAFAGAWMSMDIHMAVSDAIRAVVGPERNIDIWSNTIIETYQLPIIAGFVKMTRSLFGLSTSGNVAIDSIDDALGNVRYAITY